MNSSDVGSSTQEPDGLQGQLLGLESKIHQCLLLAKSGDSLREIGEKDSGILRGMQSSVEELLQESRGDDSEPKSKAKPAQENIPLDPDDIAFTTPLKTQPDGTCIQGHPISGSEACSSEDPVPVAVDGLDYEQALLLEYESQERHQSLKPANHSRGDLTQPAINGWDEPDIDDSQFDQLMEEFTSPDEFYSQFDDVTMVGSQESVIAISSSDEEEGEEEVDYMRTVSEMAEDVNITNLFDPRVLGCPPPTQEHIDKLKQYFGHSMFKPEQWRIIHSVLLQRRDNCAVMATGFGKSLCYQYPAVYSGKVVIVISPLISLMEDQVMALKVKGIPAVFLGSAQDSSSMAVSGIMRGDFRVVYMTPEYITRAKSLIQDIHKKIGITLLAIDEAHCVSHWGHDFRADYRHVGETRTWIHDVPVLALTATATPAVRKDICSSLKLVNPLETCTSFDRPNLFLEVHPRTDHILSDLKPLMMATKGPGNRNVYSFDGPTIVYCRTRQMTENVLVALQNAGLNCAKYHAGLSNKQRKETHHKFLRDELQCIVATVAFGMGIDKPDIRKIIHYGAPQDIESYYQEIGRAGRDGSASKCFVFYRSADFNTNRFFLRDITDEQYKAHRMKMLCKMENYLAIITQCRRRLLLSHFASSVPKNVGGHTDCCDNCRNKTTQSHSSALNQEQVNYSKEAKLLFELITDCPMGKGFGISSYIMTVRGSKSQRIPWWASGHKSFGAGSTRSMQWWRDFGMQLKCEGYLVEKAVVGGYGNIVKLTTKARRWLTKARKDSSHCINITLHTETLAAAEKPSSKQPRSYLPASRPGASTSPALPQDQVVETTPTATPIYLPLVESPTNYKTVVVERKVIVEPPPPPPPDPRMIEIQNTLYQDLLVYRNHLAHECSIAPFMVATNKLLGDFAQMRPSSLENLRKIDGVSDQWADGQFGTKVLQRIKEFCQKTGHAMTMDVSLTPNQPQLPQEMIIKDHLVCRSCVTSTLTETVNDAYTLFTVSNLSVEEISKQRNIRLNRVWSHLADALEAGYFVDYRKVGLSHEREQMIKNVIRKEPIYSDISKLKPIKDQLPDAVGYPEIKMTIAIMMVTSGYVRPIKSSASPTSIPFSPPTSSLTATPTTTFDQPGRSNHGYSWQGKSSTKRSNYWQGKSGTKRKLPSSFSGYRAHSDGNKAKNKRKKFW